jgi:hypothetical protein
MRSVAKAAIGYSVLFGTVVSVVAFRQMIFPPPVHSFTAEAAAPMEVQHQGLDMRRVIAAAVRH